MALQVQSTSSRCSPQVAFFGPAAESSINCFGYSPYPIATYLDWLRPLLLASAPRKPVVVSITGTEMETAEMLSMLQVADRV